MLKISLLIPFALQQDDQPLPLTSRRTEALFVYLLRSGQTQAREVLANLFWDDLPQTQAAGNLRVLIANLHKTLGSYVTITRQSVTFDQKSAFNCDLTNLLRALKKVQTESTGSGGLSQASADQLAQALASYQGELLPGFYLRGGQGFDEWLATEREWLWTRAIAALSDLSNAYLRLGDYRAGIEQAQRLVKFDPLREESHQQLLKLLAADGQTNAALVHYQRCVQILQTEMGVPPSSATTQLFQQIQRGEWQKPAPPITIQPPAPVARPPPDNLPRQTTPFVGRQAELARLRHYLLDPAYPLVTVVGEGGSGKTRVALAVARQLQIDELSAFPDGIWFVPLATLQPGGGGVGVAMAAAIGRALGLTFQGQSPLVEQLLALLQKRRCLLLLDNFEQLIGEPETGEAQNGDDSAVDFIINLLEQAPHLQLLITSRIPLDLNSEFVVRLGGLPVPTEALPTDAADYASLRLFAERASRITEPFHLAHHLGDVAAICRFVSGLPLAIELAAAWSGSLAPSQIVQTLQANLDFLTTRRRDIPARQRSMRVVFDHSWQLLTPRHQHVLAQLAYCHGGFTSEAARSVVVLPSEPSTLPQPFATILTSLLHHSLLQQDEAGRYSIHALLREYADEKLAACDAENCAASGVAQRHSHYFLALVAQANRQGWHTHAELVPIHVELANVRQAWQWASRTCDLTGLALGWLGLWHFYHSSALFQEGEEAFRSALEVLQAQLPNPLECLHSEFLLERKRSGTETEFFAKTRFLNSFTPSLLRPSEFFLMQARLQVAQASFLNALGRHREAVIIAQLAIAFAESVADDALTARGYAAWGTGLYRQGQYVAGQACLTQGVTAAQAAHLPLVEASLEKCLANTLQARHDFAGAQQHYQMALALYRQHGNRLGEGEALNGLGWCAQQQFDLPKALAYLQQAEQIHQHNANPHGRNMTLINLAVVHDMLGDYQQGFLCRRQMLELLDQFEDPYQRALVNHSLGVHYSRLGDDAAAEPYYLCALEIDRRLGDPGGVAWTQNNLGLLYNQRGDYAAARAMHEEALQTSRSLGTTTTEGLAWCRLGQDYFGLGELEASYDAYLNAIAIQTNLDQQVWAIESKSGLAATQLALNLWEDALTLVQEILAFLAEKSLAGARQPLLVYWNCYQVLAARSDVRAAQVLRSANQQLSEQAAKLVDEKLRQTFLENIRSHRALRQAYQLVTPSPAHY